jgi:hypothetical protein
MLDESADGAGTSNNGSDPGLNGSDLPDDGRTPFERFEDLTRSILSVPKAELDKRRAKAKRPARTRS